MKKNNFIQQIPVRGLMTVIFIIAGLAAVISCSGNVSEQVLLTASISRGKFIETLTASGSLEAVESVEISAPNFTRNFTILYMVEEGSYVNKGDAVARYDTTEFENRLEGIEDKIDDLEGGIDNYAVACENTRISLSNNLEEARNALEMEKENQAVLEFAPEIDQRKGKLQLNKREGDLIDAEMQIKRTMDDQKRVMKKKQTDLKKVSRDFEKWQGNISECTVYAPKKGLIVYMRRQRWSPVKIKVGDNVFRGHTYMTIPDLEKMMVRLEINEVDIYRLQKNMKAAITLDAYVDREYTGLIYSIGSLAHGKSSNQDIMVFDVVVHINETDVEVLRPGMTAKVDIVISSIDNTAFIPIDAIFQKTGKTGKVYTMEKGELALREVLLGVRNDDYIVIKTDFPPDTKFVLYDPNIEREGFDIKKYSVEEYKKTSGEKSEDKDKPVMGATNEASTNMGAADRRGTNRRPANPGPRTGEQQQRRRPR
ncbi:efflux RND transporter periplasmic adaptor subunit [Spirochaetota bacterium]